MTDFPSSGLGELPDLEPFALPVPGLLADLEAGEGWVALCDEFRSTPPGLRLGVVRDWMRALRVESDRALVDLFHEFSADDADASIVEQINGFKRSCRERGIACPSEFAVLLQRF